MLSPLKSKNIKIKSSSFVSKKINQNLIEKIPKNSMIDQINILSSNIPISKKIINNKINISKKISKKKSIQPLIKKSIQPLIKFEIKPLVKLDIKSLIQKNTWLRVLPTSCKVNPLYFTSAYPWTYRMSAKISNYYFGKKPIDSLLTFNINLPVKHQLRGVYFFSNYDTTNYGKLEGKNLPLYRLYPSLSSASLIQSNNYLYKPATTNCNLAYLPSNKYFTSEFNIKLSGNWWFIDNLSKVFLRKYHNVQAHNIMSKEIDSVISMFDSKLAPIFNPLSTVYNLQRTFTLGLSPKSQVFMPHKYLRSCQVFSRRFNLWSNKYYSFWSGLKNLDVVDYTIIKLIFNFWSNQLSITTYKNSNINVSNKLYNIFGKFTLSPCSRFFKNNFVLSQSALLISKLQQRVINLYNNIFKPAHINRLHIDIKQGRSLLSNLVFSTKKLVVINARNLYHYYPFYTKKPYGTGIKQTISNQSNKHNKTKILGLSQIFKLNYLLDNNCTVFTRAQQLSKWMYYNYNIKKYTIFNYKHDLFNVLSLVDNQKYLSPLTSNHLGHVSYKLIYQHLMPTFNKLQNSFNKLQLYYYLTNYKNNIQWYKKLKKNTSKWFFHHKSMTFGTKNMLFVIIILMWIISSLNRNVYKYLVSRYATSNINVSDKIDELNQTNKSQAFNWLKFYLAPQERKNLYSTWASSTINKQKTADIPVPLKNQCFLGSGINDWLNTHPQFYGAYNLFNNYLNSLKLSTFAVNNKYANFLPNHSSLADKCSNKLVVCSPQQSLLDKTLIIRSRLYKFFNIKKYLPYLRYFKKLYKQSLVYQPQIKVNKIWSPPHIVKTWQLTLDQWTHIAKKKKALWFSGYNNSLDIFQQQEKQIYLLYNRELDVYLTKYKNQLKNIEQQKLIYQRLTHIQQRIQQRRVRRQTLMRRILEREKLAQQKLAQQKLEQQKLEQQKLNQERQIVNKKLRAIPLGGRVPRNIWTTLDQQQRTMYHVNQKNLKKKAKILGISPPANIKNIQKQIKPK